MGCETMPKSVRTHLLLNAGTDSRGFAEIPDGLIRDRLFDFGIAPFTGKQINARPLPTPVLPQDFQQLGGERNLAIAQALAAVDMNDHSLAIDIAHLQSRRFGAA